MDKDPRPDGMADDTLSSPMPPREGDKTASGAHGGAPAGPVNQPARIGRYRILSRLGQGGMGVVWEAEQDQPRRRVALKVMRRDHEIDPLHIRMFRREAETLARLKHPNIAAIYESGHTDEGHDYFAMELVRGLTLDKWLAQRPTRVDDAELALRLRLFATICHAVHYAHQRGVIHRDLKPSNIIVGDSAEAGGTGSSSAALPLVKILDFGLARITDADVAATVVSEIGAIKGTLPYMSPEQVRGDVDAIDVRTDVYALGVILYEMLSGHRPYDVSKAALLEAVRVICEEPPKSLRESWPGGRRPDRDLETIVAKSLEKEPERRYGSAGELREDVDRFLDSQPILAREPSAAYQLAKMVQRNRLGAAFAATVLVLLVAFAVTATLQAQAVSKQRDRAREEAAKALAVSEFMTETLGAANPWGAGYDVTVVEALDRAVDRIQDSFADRPLVEASVRHTIGSAYRNLGQYDRAEPLLAAAEQTRTRLLGANDPETIQSVQGLAELAWRAQRFDEAVERGKDLLERQRAVFGEPSREVAGSLEDLANILAAAGRYEEAGTSIDKALAMSLALDGELSLQVAACHETRATLLQYSQGNYAAAEEQARKALDIRRRLTGLETMDASLSMNNYGVLLLLQGKYDEALPVLQEAVDNLRAVAGDRHPELAKALENLGNVYYRKRQFDRTLELLGEVAAMRRDVLGEESPAYARTLNNLGMVYDASGRPAEAERALRDAVARMEKAYGPDHPDLASSRWSLARVLSGHGKLDEAEAELRRAVAIAEKAYPEGSASRATLHLALGNLLTERGQYAEADPLLTSAHAAYLALEGPDGPRTTATASRLQKLQDARDR
ncbi:MAG: hypothetical protein Kow0062_00840 [Acidobacteriota bacterium]